MGRRRESLYQFHKRLEREKKEKIEKQKREFTQKREETALDEQSNRQALEAEYSANLQTLFRNEEYRKQRAQEKTWANATTRRLTIFENRQAKQAALDEKKRAEKKERPPQLFHLATEPNPSDFDIIEQVPPSPKNAGRKTPDLFPVPKKTEKPAEQPASKGTWWPW